MELRSQAAELLREHGQPERHARAEQTIEHGHGGLCCCMMAACRRRVTDCNVNPILVALAEGRG